MKDKRFTLTDDKEIWVSGPGARGRVSLKIYDLTIRFTKAQAKRVGAELIRRAEAEA